MDGGSLAARGTSPLLSTAVSARLLWKELAGVADM